MTSQTQQIQSHVLGTQDMGRGARESNTETASSIDHTAENLTQRCSSLALQMHVGTAVTCAA